MLRLATLFLIATLAAALFGFGHVNHQLANPSQIFFYIFLGFYLLFLMAHMVQSTKRRRMEKIRNQER